MQLLERIIKRPIPRHFSNHPPLGMPVDCVASGRGDDGQSTDDGRIISHLTNETQWKTLFELGGQGETKRPVTCRTPNESEQLETEGMSRSISRPHVQIAGISSTEQHHNAVEQSPKANDSWQQNKEADSHIRGQ
jgi:hypothetical protein